MRPRERCEICRYVLMMESSSFQITLLFLAFIGWGSLVSFYHQEKQGVNDVGIKMEDFANIEIAHSMPEIVDPEITEPTTWTVEYRLPFSILKNYADVVMPASGETWRANFYKCADATSQPHWLTWAPVEFSRPNFHLPEFFGTLSFE